MAEFAAYGHAIVSLAGMGLLALILGPIAAIAKSREGLVSGAVPHADYASATYRKYRAHQNAAENIGVFVAVTMAAMLAGASPLAVNWLASLYFLSRILHAVIHIRGIGAADFGPRTFVFGFGAMMCWLLALTAIYTVFSHAA